MKAIDFTIWKTIIEMGVAPEKFNGLPDIEQAGVYNTVRFLTKEKVAGVSATSEIRIKVHRVIDKRVSRILFD